MLSRSRRWKPLLTITVFYAPGQSLLRSVVSDLLHKWKVIGREDRRRRDERNMPAIRLFRRVSYHRPLHIVSPTRPPSPKDSYNRVACTLAYAQKVSRYVDFFVLLPAASARRV